MRTSPLGRLTFLVMLSSLLALLALLAGGAGPAQARRGHARKAPATSSEDCKKDTDCVLVLDDCCPCNEGGKQRAIPKKQKATYEKDRKKRCEGTACTEMMSQDPSCSARPFCGAGICELGDASPDSAP